MTVRELLDVISPRMEIFIKPNGRRLYFEGVADDTPEDLFGAVVTELVPQVYRDDECDAIKKFYGALGVWVNAIPEWDERADREKAAAKQKE